MPAPRRESCPHCGPIAFWQPGIVFHADCFHVLMFNYRAEPWYERMGYISCKPPAHVFERDAQPTRTHCIEHGAVTYEAVVMWESAEAPDGS